MTDVSNEEIEAARIALSKLCADGCEVLGDVRCCIDPPCPCAKFARAALTAAAEVREKARSDNQNHYAITALNFDSVARREEAQGRVETANLFRLAASDIRKAAGLMPIYGATEPDQGEDILGMRKGRE